MKPTIILRHMFTDRTYQCQSQGDAIILFDALTKLGFPVEMWDGATLLQRYNPNF